MLAVHFLGPIFPHSRETFSHSVFDDWRLDVGLSCSGRQEICHNDTSNQNLSPLKYQCKIEEEMGEEEQPSRQHTWEIDR